MDEHFQHTVQVLIHVSTFDQYCDITFLNGPPLVGVRLKPALGAALMYGAGAKKLAGMLERLETRDGTVFMAQDVWMVIPFPNGLPTEAELSGIDLADGDAEVAPGVSIREMVRQVYRCASDEETERMLRRVLAA